ncbi:MAG: lipocalin-like domain-containing protein, partial [Chloroflexota bacterium]
MLHYKRAVYLRLILFICLPIAVGGIFWSSLLNVQATTPMQVVRDEPTLPGTPFNYANPSLPAHFTGRNVRNLESDGDLSLKLSLMPLKPIVLQGDKGLSQKSRDPGN